MTLADQIIEHGPCAQDYLIGPGFAGPLRWLRAAELNELRDDLIGARKTRESWDRWTITGYGSRDSNDIHLRHQCGWEEWIDKSLTLAELNQRADEHTEECR